MSDAATSSPSTAVISSMHLHAPALTNPRSAAASLTTGQVAQRSQITRIMETCPRNIHAVAIGIMLRSFLDAQPGECPKMNDEDMVEYIALSIPQMAKDWAGGPGVLAGAMVDVCQWCSLHGKSDNESVFRWARRRDAWRALASEY